MGVYITILCFLPFPFRSASLRRQFFDLLRLLRKIKPATYLPTYLPIIVSLDTLRQDPPLKAILVIFGRRALIFFLFESSWNKMKNDTTFVRMRSGDHLGDAKMSKKGTSRRRI